MNVSNMQIPALNKQMKKHQNKTKKKSQEDLCLMAGPRNFAITIFVVQFSSVHF